MENKAEIRPNIAQRFNKEAAKKAAAIVLALAATGATGYALGKLDFSQKPEVVYGPCLTQTKDVDLASNGTKTFFAEHALAVGDLNIDGVDQFDYNAHTSAITEIYSPKNEQGLCEQHTIKTKWGGAITIFEEGTSFSTVANVIDQDVSEMKHLGQTPDFHFVAPSK